MDPQIQDVQSSKRINEPNSEQDMMETEIDVKKCTKDDGQEAETKYCSISALLVTVCGCLQRNQFVIFLILAIVLAKAYPPVGASYVQADITATWIAVMIIFLISGIGLKVEELSKAFQQIYFNSFVQIFNFGIVSATVFGVSRFLGSKGAISSALADGMLICSCLPMAINVVIVLTVASGGDEAAAVFNTACGNLIGIFLSPALILMYLGTAGSVSISEVFLKLILRVLVPLIMGLALRRLSGSVAKLVTEHKRKLQLAQQACLVFIVYCTFCQTFEMGMDASIQDIIVTAVVQLSLLLFSMLLAWYSLKHLGFAAKLRVCGLFGCTGKTIALGVPLINSIYDNDPQRALYTLPLLIWHPLQLIVGSYLSARLATFVKGEGGDEGVKARPSVPEVTMAGSSDSALEVESGEVTA